MCNVRKKSEQYSTVTACPKFTFHIYIEIEFAEIRFHAEVVILWKINFFLGFPKKHSIRQSCMSDKISRKFLYWKNFLLLKLFDLKSICACISEYLALIRGWNTKINTQSPKKWSARGNDVLECFFNSQNNQIATKIPKYSFWSAFFVCIPFHGSRIDGYLNSNRREFEMNYKPIFSCSTFFLILHLTR